MNGVGDALSYRRVLQRFFPPELPNPLPASKCLDKDAEDARLVGVLFKGLPPAFGVAQVEEERKEHSGLP